MPVSDEQMNRILTNISENIPSDCSTGRRIQRGSTASTEVSNSVNFNITEYEAYRNDIEFVNSFKEQVLVDERNYFLSKYGDKVYNFLLTQRNEYITEKNRSQAIEGCKRCPTNNTSGQNGMDASSNTCDASDNELFNYLQGQFPAQNADTVFKKIEYRVESHEFLSRINKYLTIFYFFVLFVMLIMLTVSQRLFLKERFVLYLFLIVLPFIFPFLFDLLKKIYKYFFPGTSDFGPKNAFLENRDLEIDKKTFHGKYDSSLNIINYND